MLKVIVGQLITNVERDGHKATLYLGHDCVLRFEVPVRCGPDDLVELVGQKVMAATADDTTFSLTIERNRLVVSVDDIEPGTIEAVILSLPNVIVVWP